MHQVWYMKFCFLNQSRSKVVPKAKFLAGQGQLNRVKLKYVFLLFARRTFHVVSSMY